MQRQNFIRWFVPLAAIWIFASWPHSQGKGDFYWLVGFPLVFMSKADGQWQPFNPIAFIIDAALGFAFTYGLARACAWSRKTPTENR